MYHELPPVTAAPQLYKLVDLLVSLSLTKCGPFSLPHVEDIQSWSTVYIHL